MDFSHARFNILLPRIDFQMNETGDLWSDAESINREVSRACVMSEPLAYIPLFDFEMLDEYNSLLFRAFNENDQASADMLYGSRDCDFAVSNIGTYVYDRYSKSSASGSQRRAVVDLSEMYYGDVQNSLPNFTYGCILYASFWKGEIQCLLTANSSALSSPFHQRLIELFEKNILTLL